MATATAPLALAAGAPVRVSPDTLDVDALYDLRRDAEGVPYTRAATLKQPAIHSEQATFKRLNLLDRGATESRSWLQYPEA